ncbi:MAG: SNF2 helicase associated domain-containing protein [Bacteroidetes bacterium]|nr:SNF2 helicase associated domain-containing protein [Bacteroidota bacterium]
MSLPTFLKFAYNHGTDEVIRRGKRIFNNSGVQLLDVDQLLGQIRFRVKNDQYYTQYTVTIAHFMEEKAMNVRCQCPYNLGEICKHEVAALFQLNDMATAGFFENLKLEYDQTHTLVRMRQVTEEMVAVFTAPESFALAKVWAKKGLAKKIKIAQEKLSAELKDGDSTYSVMLRQNDDRYFDTSCTCEETSHPLCRHKATLFLQVLKQRGPAFFRSLQNWDAQKDKLLQLYGYSLKDDLSGKFEFSYHEGRPTLKVLDSSIKKVERLEQEIATTAVLLKKEVEQDTSPVKKVIQRIGIVLNTHSPLFPEADWSLIIGNVSDTPHELEKPMRNLDLAQYIAPTDFATLDRDLLPEFRKLRPEEVIRQIRKDLPFGDLLDDPDQLRMERIASDWKQPIWEYLLPRYKRILTRHSKHAYCFLKTQESALEAEQLQVIEFSNSPVVPLVQLTQLEDSVQASLSWQIGNRSIPYTREYCINAALILDEHNLHCVDNIQYLNIIEQFLPEGVIDIPLVQWPDLLKNQVLQWHKVINVSFSEELIAKSFAPKPSVQLFLSERDRNLVLQPVFTYGNTEIKLDYHGEILLPVYDKVQLIQRDEAAEATILKMLQNLHSDMKYSAADGCLLLPSEAVLDGSWFFRFVDEMREQQIQVLGFENLKRLRISTFKPKTEVRISSDIDWFDTTVDVSFGTQRVTIADIKKAIGNHQQFVPLGDGSVGLLPEEWLKKYGLLLKMGEHHQGKLRLKKIHFSVLDTLLESVDEEQILQDLQERKDTLAAIIDRDFSSLPPPAELKATLRPYQHAGFQWLAFLREARWGGILADDMGLGKTVQALAYLQQFASENTEAKFLVVCPTTLMFNWEAEIKKFTPNLSYTIHHGAKRTSDAKDFSAFQIVITTYGTMRSDISWLRNIRFDYAVLDESQAIKNPQSQVAKASLLLNAMNKLALSGTPVQNNTFDLYAQMNFLNPGLLGSREFFNNEFATPIDKFREEAATQQLKQLTYPFMLRRTKEQVAKDLPPKTESILYCEMGAEQRKIYDAYRNTYQDTLLGLIDERGLEKARFSILQGLTRLRQICDSPALLNEEVRLPNHSVKSEELIREILENVGSHKALVFSQFLGMLAIIRQQLEEANIPYVYFDGSSSAAAREVAIQEFQNNDSCRVFLISLKAGGIGLNLTAADYVYIVDPWWNPAVEQQAIDRTHRIGQTKNIFAYRLICKDTIEEKMLLLQERKLALAADLVVDDGAAMKRLTREDIQFLLS